MQVSQREMREVRRGTVRCGPLSQYSSTLRSSGVQERRDAKGRLARVGWGLEMRGNGIGKANRASFLYYLGMLRGVEVTTRTCPFGEPYTEVIQLCVPGRIWLSKKKKIRRSGVRILLEGGCPHFRCENESRRSGDTYLGHVLGLLCCILPRGQPRVTMQGSKVVSTQTRISELSFWEEGYGTSGCDWAWKTSGRVIAEGG